ncbi:regulatory protein DeoR [Thermincola ferriacetica]|uniref:Regulatory protein DeoR n=2 Tax=Thermincola TaxID=278993 RepID=D5X8P8_THEPJ|nr:MULTISPECIES: transcription factor FapR [Thermincola]ADG82924.1 regulatory protein DeoR [Thermincola potens JR]KNZ69597.1 regulatory protein DeoR [Thermincola ferriacetica]
MASTSAKARRLEKLKTALENNPFLTDEELARMFSVSIQTIRLDRLELNIPEVRERVKQMAEKSYAELRSLSGSEVIGDLIDLELNRSGISVMNINEDMIFQKTGIARGHFIFAQANSLAVACINAEVALTGTARIFFKRQVKLGERIVAKATVKGRKGNKYIVGVESKSGQEIVFEGTFIIFALSDKEATMQ